MSSNDLHRRVRAAVDLAREQGFEVQARNRRVRVFKPGEHDRAITIGLFPSENRSAHNAIAALRRIGVEISHDNDKQRQQAVAALPEPEPEVTITDPTVKVAEVVHVSGHDLVTHQGDWRDLTVQERAQEVWQAARLHCQRNDAKQRKMLGTTYWIYPGPLSEFVHGIFPTMPYDPEDGDHGTQGAKPVYDCLKANKNVVTTKVGNTFMQLIRNEFSEVKVTTVAKSAASPAKRRGGEAGEFPCDFPGCDHPPFTYARALGTHKFRKHGIEGTSAAAKRRAVIKEAQATSPPAPTPPASQPDPAPTPEPAPAPRVVDLTAPSATDPMAELDEWLGMVREGVQAMLRDAGAVESLTPLQRLTLMHRITTLTPVEELLTAASNDQNANADMNVMRELFEITNYVTSATQRLLVGGSA